MNKKIVSLIIALTLPLTFLVGCKNSSSEEETFVMTEDTTALDGNVEYNAKTYKESFFSTENYSAEHLQNEFEAIVKEITSKEDRDELLELLDSYSNTQDGDFDFVKTTYDKYSTQDESADSITLDSNGMYEIASRLYKATLNATKKYYDINDFYIYYKDQLTNSTSTNDEEEFENEVRMTAIKEYTIASIYKEAYNDSFISKIIATLNEESTTVETTPVTGNENTTVETTVPEQNKTQNITQNPTVEDTNTSDDSQDETTTEDSDDDTYPEYLEFSEALKSQIYDAGVNSAIEFIGQNITTSSSEYCRQIYDALENDNPLGDNKEEGYKSFLDGFKTTLENNGIEFN